MLYEIVYKTNVFKDEKSTKPMLRNVEIKSTIELNNFNIEQVLNKQGKPYKKKCRIFNETGSMVIEKSYDEVLKAKKDNRIVVKGFRL